jgi:hypothetical protein
VNGAFECFINMGRHRQLIAPAEHLDIVYAACAEVPWESFVLHDYTALLAAFVGMLLW